MRIIILGVTALRECLVDDDVQEILAISRKCTNKKHEKLKEIELENGCFFKNSSDV